METIISLGYILSHYNQKGGANVCIVLGKWVCQTFIYGYIVTKYGCNCYLQFTFFSVFFSSIRVDPGPTNRGPTSLLALKIRTPVANTVHWSNTCNLELAKIIFGFLGCFYQSQKEKWVWTINKTLKGTMLYTTELSRKWAFIWYFSGFSVLQKLSSKNDSPITFIRVI
jgi:hypothetical protein